MKKILLSLLCVITTSIFNAQSDQDIANVYIKRANTAMESIDIDAALANFEKAMTRLDTLTDKNVAILGSKIYFEIHHQRETPEEQLKFLENAKKYSAIYFALYKGKKTETYLTNTESSILIEETLVTLKAEIQELEEQRIAKEKELKKIDSLKLIWADKSKALSLNVEEILPFNKNNIAIYKKGENFGLINDTGVIILEANEYKVANTFDGYIIFTDKLEEPTKIYSYNTNLKTGFELPKPSDLNPLSTNFGQVMLPRANGRLVMYPNNSYKVLAYDLEAKKKVIVANQKELFKDLKKGDIISKSNKEGNLKINKKWYGFGGHLGGGIYPLLQEGQYTLYGFLCSIDGTVLKTATNFSHLGAFYDGKVQALKDGETVWVNQNGTKVSAAKNKNGLYKGESKVVKLEDGTYQIKQNNVIILGDQKLGRIQDFLKENNPKK